MGRTARPDRPTWARPPALLHVLHSPAHDSVAVFVKGPPCCSSNCSRRKPSAPGRTAASAWLSRPRRTIGWLWLSCGRLRVLHPGGQSASDSNKPGAILLVVAGLASARSFCGCAQAGPEEDKRWSRRHRGGTSGDSLAAERGHWAFRKCSPYLPRAPMTSLNRPATV